MASPTGFNTEPTGPIAVTTGAWVELVNPNSAFGVTITSSEDVYVRYEQPQPAPTDTGMYVWANTYYPHRAMNQPLGKSKYNNPIPGVGAVWVRAVSVDCVVFANWQRE